MKKKSLLALITTSFALAISVITFSSFSDSKHTAEYFAATGDSEQFYKENNLKPVAATSFASYSDNPSLTNVYNQDKTWYLDPISIGSTWDSYRGDGITIAVIDTGLRSQHEDFYYNSTSRYLISKDSACFTHNEGDLYSVTPTYVKQSGGTLDWTVIENSSAGHGTNVTSTIASRINNKGTVGIAPNVKILFLKAATLYTDEVSEAIKYAADKYADIITMSLGLYSSKTLNKDGGTVDCDAKNIPYSSNAASLYSTAIDYAYNKGCLMLASAGNEDVYSKSYPACNNHVIGVGALTESTIAQKASYSNYNSKSDTSSGNNNVDVTAPGKVKVADKDSNTDYLETLGTSFSCPIVAGALSLYYQKNNFGGSTNVTTRKNNAATATQALYNSCVDIGDNGWDRMYGYGALDVSSLCGTSDTSVSSILVDKGTINIYDNSSADVVGTLQPIYASNKKIEWTSSDSSIATVKSTSITTEPVTIQGVNKGSCTVTAKSADNPSLTKTINVNVAKYVYAYFTASADTNLHVGDSTKINISWTEGQPIDDTLVFESNDPNILSVDEDGNVTALAVGEGTVTIISDDDEKTITFNVSKEESTQTIYTFTSSSWGATPANWTSGKNGAGFSNSGVQVIQKGSGANATSPKSFNDVKKVVVSYCTNASSGAGTISVDVGNSNLGLASVNTTGGTTARDLEITNTTSLSGSVKLTVTCTTNSIYVCGITIFEGSSGGDTPVGADYTVTFDANGGSLGDNPATKTVTSGTKITLKILSRSGFTFLGWSTSSTATSATYTGGSSYQVTSNQTLFAVWKENSTPTPTPDPGSYYANISDTLTGDSLLTSLRSLNLTKRISTVGYNLMGTGTNTDPDNSPYMYTDYDPSTIQYKNGVPYGTKILSFYSGASTTSWNKEHVWPASRLTGGRSGNIVDDDIYMARPTITSENSNRGNSVFYEGKVDQSNGWDPVAAFPNNTYDSIRGEAARIIFYCMTVDSTLVLNENTSNSGNNMGRLTDLLKWNLLNPVNDREVRRQAGGQYLQGNRNAFVDHPEYACKIWGNTSNETRQICSLAPVTNKILIDLTVTGAPNKTEYVKGETFDPTGLTVTATFDDDSTEDVTSSVIWTPNPLDVDVTSVTGTYSYLDVTKTVTVSDIVVNPWTVVGGEYTIEFENSTSDGSTELTASTILGDCLKFNTLAASASNVSKVYPGKFGLKMGSSSAKGSFTLNLFDDAKNSIKSIDVTCAKYGDDSGTVNYSIGTESGSFTPIKDGSTQTKTFTNPISADSVTISTSSKRGYVSKVVLHVEDSSDPVAVTGVNLNNNSLSLPVNTQETLIASVLPTNATNKAVTWLSSDTSIATVTDGVINAVSVGDCTITVTTEDGGFTVTCSVTVTPAPIIEYKLEANTETVPFMSGTNHKASVGVTLYKYVNNVKSSPVTTGSCEVDTSSLGLKEISFAYQSETFTTNVKVTNVGASVGIDTEGHDEYSFADASAKISFSNDDAVKAGSGSIIGVKQGTTKNDITFNVTRTGTYEGFNGGTNTFHKIGTKASPEHNLTLTSTTEVVNLTSLDFAVGYYTKATDIKVTVGNNVVYTGKTTTSSGISTISATLDKPYSGIVKIEFYSSTGRTLLQSVKLNYQELTNIHIDGEKYDSTPTVQASGWSSYFRELTRTESTCLASNDEDKLTGLKAVWEELKAEYNAMNDSSKDAFFSESDLADIREHYRFIISKFGKNSKYGNDGLEDFVVNSTSVKLTSLNNNRNKLFNFSDTPENIILISSFVAISVVSLGLYFAIRKKKEI